MADKYCPKCLRRHLESRTKCEVCGVPLYRGMPELPVQARSSQIGLGEAPAQDPGVNAASRLDSEMQRFPRSEVQVAADRPLVGSDGHIFGYRFECLPDFLQDHTLLEEESSARIAELLNRWVQFVAGLWVREGVTYGLVYHWRPPSAPSEGSDREATPGEIQVGFLCRVVGSVKEADALQATLKRQWESVGLDPVKLTSAEVAAFGLHASNSVYEVRQADERIRVESQTIRRLYEQDLQLLYGEGEASRRLTQIDERGAYVVQPWRGPRGSFLGPFAHLSSLKSEASVWVLLRPVRVTEVADERRWLMEWSRHFAKWAEDSGSTGESVTITRSESHTESQGENKGWNYTVSDSTNSNWSVSGPGGLFDDRIHSLGGGQGTSVNRGDSSGYTKGTSEQAGKSISLTRGGRSYTHKDPAAKWMAEDCAAQLRRLHNPFLITVYCVANEDEHARSLAYAYASAVQDDAGTQDSRGADGDAPMSRAEAVRLDDRQRSVAIDACLRVQLDPRRQQSSTRLELGDPVGLNLLVDARAAAVAFRLPINVRAGIPGIAIRQRPPGRHPGAIQQSPHLGHLSLGTIEGGGVLQVEVDALTKHALIVGFTGSGKTVTVLNLLHRLWTEHHKPFLVLESAKAEYRGLLGVPAFAPAPGIERGSKADLSLLIYTLGNENCAPFRLNPFELLPGIRLEAHLARLQSCFEGALPPIGPLSSLIYEALLECYRREGWALTDVGPEAVSNPYPAFPRMQGFADEMLRLVSRRGYKGEVRDNLTAAIHGRILPLTIGSKGRMFDCGRSSPAPATMFEQPTVLEMNDLNLEDKALVTMFLLMLLREYRETTGIKHGHLRHITVVEEAHNVLEQVQSTGGGEGSGSDARYRAVQAFCNIMSEIRAYGEGIIIADQSPEKLARDAIRNTNLQIVHNLRDHADREVMAEAMLMSDEQREFLGRVLPGSAAAFLTGLEGATFVRVPRYYPDAAKGLGS